MKNKAKRRYQTPDDYVTGQPIEYRETLEKLRRLIRKYIPEAEELIGYQIICYKFHTMLIGIGTKKRYCSFHTMSPELVESMAPELTNVTYSGATIHFPLDHPLPEDLIQKIILRRKAENMEKAKKNAS